MIKDTEKTGEDSEGKAFWMRHKCRSVCLHAVGVHQLPGTGMYVFTTSSWQIEEERVEAVTNFIFLGSKITADGDCSHEIKRRLFLGRKAMTNLDSLLENRDITW